MSMSVVAVIIILGIIIGTTIVMGKADDKESVSTVEDTGMAVVNQEMFTLTSAISDGLNDYDGIGDIHIDYHEQITVQTSLDSSDIDKAKEIQKSVEDLLKSEELESISNIESYQVSLLNKDGELIK